MANLVNKNPKAEFLAESIYRRLHMSYQLISQLFVLKNAFHTNSYYYTYDILKVFLRRDDNSEQL